MGLLVSSNAFRIKSTMPQWKPGRLIDVQSETFQVRSLLMSDVIAQDGNEPPWYGDSERRAKVWSPKMTTTDYLTGLIGACDQQKLFAFLLSCSKTNRSVGFAKAQLAQEGDESLFIPTIVVGDAEDQGSRFGVQAALLLSWFAFAACAASQISLRIYADNAIAIRRAEQFQFILHASREELVEGEKKIYRDYRLPLAVWRKHFAEAAEAYRLSELTL